jgi:hypothetical protein
MELRVAGNETCATCPHFVKLGETGPECHRNPPGFIINNRSGEIVGIWPPTKEERWCGEHPRRK